MGSNDGLNLVNGDLFRSHESSVTGFVGQNPEVQWLQNLKHTMESSEHVGPANWLPYSTLGSSNEATGQRVDALHARQMSSQLRWSDTAHLNDASFMMYDPVYFNILKRDTLNSEIL